MFRVRTPLFALSLVFALAACEKGETPTATPDDATAEDGHDHDGAGDKHDGLEGREVVNNWEAQPGEVTVCPISGKKFEVKEDSGHFAYQGYDFVFCCAGKCLEQVEADPGKFLDALVEEAGGPAADPDPNEGGAIDDT